MNEVTYTFEDSRTETHKTFTLNRGRDSVTETFPISEPIDREAWRAKWITVLEETV